MKREEGSNAKDKSVRRFTLWRYSFHCWFSRLLVNHICTYVWKGRLKDNLCLNRLRLLYAMPTYIVPYASLLTYFFFFHPADPRRITSGGLPGIPTQLWHLPQVRCEGLFRLQVACTPSLPNWAVHQRRTNNQWIERLLWWFSNFYDMLFRCAAARAFAVQMAFIMHSSHACSAMI